MIGSDESSGSTPSRWIPFAAAFIALVGLADAVYLTVHYYTATPVPCSIIEGCETVLTSQYAEYAGVPTAAFGAVAYFAAFSLAILAAYGNRLMWRLFGIQAAIMAVVTCWLIYLQAFVIGAFCQFCLISALTTFLLLILYIISMFRRRLA
ncbi:MAG: vitamin K epoxide reductase family protein [Pyrinomonadaceae bacterium]